MLARPERRRHAANPTAVACCPVPAWVGSSAARALGGGQHRCHAEARPSRANEPSGEHVLLAMLGAAMTLVAAIAVAAQMPEATGVIVAFLALVAVAGAIGIFIARLLRDPDPD